jgi:hypothetical protein
LTETLGAQGYIVSPLDSTEVAVLARDSASHKEAMGRLLLLVNKWRPPGVTVAVVSPEGGGLPKGFAGSDQSCD